MSHHPNTENISPTPPPNNSSLPVVPPHDALHKAQLSPCMSTHLTYFLVCLRASTFLNKIYEGSAQDERSWPAEIAESEDEHSARAPSNTESCKKYWTRFIRCTQARNGDKKAKEWLLKQEKGMVDLRRNDTWQYKREYVNALKKNGRLLKGGADGVIEDMDTFVARTQEASL